MGYSFLPLAFQSLFRSPPGVDALLAVYLIVLRERYCWLSLAKFQQGPCRALVPGLGSGEPLFEPFIKRMSQAPPLMPWP